jgi:hypothetical protein
MGEEPIAVWANPDDEFVELREFDDRMEEWSVQADFERLIATFRKVEGTPTDA